MSTLLSTRAAADYLGVSPRTLESWRRLGGGPAFIRLSANRCSYHRADLDTWIDERRRLSTTAEPTAAAAGGAR